MSSPSAAQLALLVGALVGLCQGQKTHTWHPIPLDSGEPFASVAMGMGGVQSFPLPWSVPAHLNVSEVLLYVKTFTDANPETVDDVRVFTRVYDQEFSKYLYLYRDTLNSDNLWLPLGKERAVHVELQARHGAGDAMYMYAIGYRLQG